MENEKEEKEFIHDKNIDGKASKPQEKSEAKEVGKEESNKEEMPSNEVKEISEGSENNQPAENPPKEEEVSRPQEEFEAEEKKAEEVKQEEEAPSEGSENNQPAENPPKEEEASKPQEEFEAEEIEKAEEVKQEETKEKIERSGILKNFEEVEKLSSSSTRVIDKTDKKMYIILRIRNSNMEDVKKIYNSMHNKRIGKIKKVLDENTLLLEDPGKDYKPLSNLIKSRQNIENLLFILEKFAYTIFALNKSGYAFFNFDPSKILVSESEKELLIYDLTSAVKKGTKISGIFTPYTPYEAIKGASIDEVSDVYGIGTLIYETLFGQQIPEDLNYISIGKNINKPYIIQFLPKCISAEREKRFPNMYSVGYGLKKIRENLHKKHYNIEHSEFSNIGINPSRTEDEDAAGLISYRTIVRGQSEFITAFALADGMGGGEAGDVASEVAVKTFFDNFMKNVKNIKEENANQFIRNFTVNSNEEILKIKNERRINEIGTTFVCGFILNNKLYIGNVGDSRAYLIRDNKLKQLTKDHSLVQKLIDSGGKKEEILKTTSRSIITKNLGSDKIKADYVDTLENTLKQEYIELKNDDKVLLCCDGLWDALSEKEIEEITQKEKSVDESSKMLVEKAVEEDGSDNTTVLLLKFIEIDENII
ncbi:PP2C family protein-serine/threonine phosphatase [Mesoaciditoga lauensis]|uniref:PP2C family protein-serine/threonine phosphatase n=1 Tax=Mesoaciditoga lauensis TaxID=1495039 RepID=UPI0005683EF8|nr:protein phosphatase 2C domain-containing protein [Mesoaciditoga lauensis]